MNTDINNANYRSEIIKNIREHKVTLRTRFHVESLALFGSVSRGEAQADSDVDILVRYEQTPGLFLFIDLKRYLEELVGRPVDLVTEAALKKQLRQGILQEAIYVT